MSKLRKGESDTNIFRQKTGFTILLAFLLLLSSFGLGNISFLVPAASASESVKAMVSGGSNHALALRSDGTVWAWGDNRNGQLGDGTSEGQASSPQQVKYDNEDPLTDFIKVVANGNHSMALRSDGTLWEWGGWVRSNNYVEDILSPRQVPLPQPVKEMATGGFFCLALLEDGTVWGWGKNDWGQLATGVSGLLVSFYDTPVQVVGPGGIGYLTDVVKLVSSDSFAAALTSDGRLYGWGNNNSNPLEIADYIGSNWLISVPTLITAIPEPVVDLDAGAYGLGAVLESGKVWATADPFVKNDQVFTGDTYYSLPPVTDAKQVTMGSNSLAALTASGKVWTRGVNGTDDYTWSTFILGNPDVGYQSLQVPVKGPNGEGYLTDAIYLSEGNNTTYVIRKDGTLWSWGSNQYGQLGIGVAGDGESANPSKVPVAVTVDGTQFRLAPSAISVNKDALKTAIDNAQSFLDTAVAGTDVGQYPVSAIDSLQTLLQNANVVYDETWSSQSTVDNAALLLSEQLSYMPYQQIPYANKVALASSLLQASQIMKQAVQGTDPGSTPPSAFETLQTAYDAAKAVMTNVRVGQEQVDTVFGSLTDSIASFQNASILPIPAFFTDFENDEGGFHADGTNSTWAYGTPNNYSAGPAGAHSGTAVWGTNLSGNYNNYEDSYLISDSIDASGNDVQKVVVSAHVWEQTEGGFDYSYIDVSKDGGQSWQTVHQFTGGNNSNEGEGEGEIEGEVHYASVSTDWKKLSYELDPSYAVPNLQIRFHLSSDESVIEPGIYVDDVAVYVVKETLKTALLMADKTLANVEEGQLLGQYRYGVRSMMQSSYDAARQVDNDPDATEAEREAQSNRLHHSLHLAEGLKVSTSLGATVPNGSIVSYGGQKWIMLDHDSGKMISFKQIGTSPWSEDGSNAFNPAAEGSLAYQLNHPFLESLENSDWIQEHAWDVTGLDGRIWNGTGPVSTKVGLLSANEYLQYGTVYPGGSGMLSHLENVWTLTPIASTDSDLDQKVYQVDDSGNLSEASPGVYRYIRPVIYLRTDLIQAAGSGTDEDPFTLTMDTDAFQVSRTTALLPDWFRGINPGIDSVTNAVYAKRVALPLEDTDGVAIQWSSDQPSVIDSLTGEVKNPLPEQHDAVVELTAVVSKNQSDRNVNFTLTIPAIQDPVQHPITGILIPDSLVSPGFDPELHDYQVTVSDTVGSIVVRPSLASESTMTVSGATYTVSGLDYIVDIRSIDDFIIEGTTPLGTKESYKFSVARLKSDKNMLSLEVPNQKGTALIDNVNHIVTAEVLYGTSVTSLTPVITVSNGATFLPEARTTLDFSQPVTYFVTAEDGSMQAYRVTVTAAKDMSALAVTASESATVRNVPFLIDVYDAKDANGLMLNGLVHVVVKSGDAEEGIVFDDTAAFVNGKAMLSIHLTKAKRQTLTFTLSGVSIQPSVIVDVQPSEAEIVAADKAALTLASILGSNPDESQVTTNLVLTKTGTLGSAIEWASDNVAIAPDGKVTRSTFTEGDRTVKLTATVSKGTVSESVSFTLVVKANAISEAEIVATDKVALTLASILGSNPDESQVTTNLVLPKIGTLGSAIEWASDNMAIAPDGTVTRSTFTDGDRTVKLTANVSKGTVSESVIFTLVVKANAISEAEIVAADKAALTLASILGSNPDESQITTNLVLPKTGALGSAIEWASDNTAIVSDGTVTRGTYTEGDRTVKLTATVSKGTVSESVSFTLEVKANVISEAEIVAADKAALTLASILGSNTDENYITSSLVLPTTGALGSAIEWTSNNAAIAPDGTVTRPATAIGKAVVHLTATLSKGSAEQNAVFEITVLSTDPVQYGTPTVVSTDEPITFSDGVVLDLQGISVPAGVTVTANSVNPILTGTLLQQAGPVVEFSFQGMQTGHLEAPVKLRFSVAVGTDLSKVGIFYFNEMTGKWEYQRTNIDSKGNVSAYVSHFSTYGVFTADQAAAPVANPASGSVLHAGMSITLTTATADAIIRYTIDGADPTSASTMYDSAHVPTAGTGNGLTVKAIAQKDGMIESIVQTFVYTTSALSDNAMLSGILASTDSSFSNLLAVTPDGSAGTTVYSTTVSNVVYSVYVNALAEHSSAHVSMFKDGLPITVSNAVYLNVGVNPILLLVTAENGNQQEFTLNVNRLGSGNADISGIRYRDVPLLQSGNTFMLNVGWDLATVSVLVGLSDPTAQMTVTGATYDMNVIHIPDLSFDASRNVYPIIVTAQDGTVKTYSLQIVRSPEPSKDILDTNHDGVIAIDDVTKLVFEQFDVDGNGFDSNDVIYLLHQIEPRFVKMK